MILPPDNNPNKSSETDSGIEASAPIQSKLIVVLGMHRSGTSAITRALKVLGVELGDSLIPPMEDVNEKGFWENIELNTFDMQVLQSLGSDWHRLSPIQPTDVEALQNQGYSFRATELLNQIIGDAPVFGVKDPRVALLLPFWNSIFQDSTKWDACYVIAIRNPLSVVKSLAKRDGFDIERSYLLWLGHVMASLANTVGEKRVFVDYDCLMQDPKQELKRMADSLDLEINQAELQIYENEFLDKGLQHTCYTPDDLLRDDSCPPLAREVYQALFDIASNKTLFEENAFESQVNNWKNEFERFESPLKLIDKLYSQILHADQLKSERDGQIARLNEAATERDGQIARLNEAAIEREGQIARLNEAATERDGQIARLNEAAIEREGQIASLNETAAEHEAEIVLLNQVLKGKILGLNQAMDNNYDQIAQLNKFVAERDVQIESLNKTVFELKEINASHHQDLLKRDSQNISLNKAIAENDGQTEVLNQKIATLEKELTIIYQSKSWLFTDPLRSIRRTMISRPHIFIRKHSSAIVRQFWYSLPLTNERKQRLKGSIFRNVPTVLRWTRAYRDWHNLNVPTESGSIRSPNLPSVSTNENVEYVPLFKGEPLKNKPVKLICFYLPQFHPIPENNEWWGDGFTEWTNVQPAEPQFVGHYQPRVPGELGYYDLRDKGIQHRQIELAKLYGIEGFCFYFYWFGGTRLLETPIQNYLEDVSLDLPFCLCWANENWSRRWDGLDSEILIAQQHSAEDDIGFIQHVARYMRDSRYIRIDNKPLLLVYRPSLLPSAKKTAERWRQWCRDNGIGEIYLAYTQSFETIDPAKYGFDAAIEFPPNNSAPPNITDNVASLSEEFGCTVYDWRVFVERSENYQQPGYQLFRSVCPSWDNTARRKNRATVFLNSCPALYQRWLENAIQETKQTQSNLDERLIFVNAWNEWAEGAHLEPDANYGYAYLQATRDALYQSGSPEANSILVVTHDCHPHGAQYLILEVCKQLKQNGMNVSILALDGGIFLDDFAQIGRTLNAKVSTPQIIHNFLTNLRGNGVVDVITSTTVSGSILPLLKKLGFQVLSLIHELPGVIREMQQEGNARSIAKYADKIVFPSSFVHKLFWEIAPIDPEKVVIRPQGLLRNNPYKSKKTEAYQEICKKHGIAEGSQIILNVAYLDSRKGADLFVDIAVQTLKVQPNAVFIWVGHAEPVMEKAVTLKVTELNLQNKVLFVGFVRDPMAYYASASVYALTSREDPFPNVVLESTEVSVPIVAFEGASGAGDFIVEHGGRLASYLNTEDFAASVCELLANPAKKPSRPVGSLQQYIQDMLYHLNGFPRISVIVPNYNYERHIGKRLESIYKQGRLIYELIVLDDASIDNSVEIIKKQIEQGFCDAQLIVNNTNSGSVFRQWQLGLALCKGDLVWIAEADDLADDNFLDELVKAFYDESVVLAYSQSKQIDENDNVLSLNYHDYTQGVSDHWLTSHVRDGNQEISEALCIKNTIPNVSAVLFRRSVLEKAINTIGEDLFSYSVAGDWLVYIYVLVQGKLYFCETPLNQHRRHTSSVTSSTQVHNHLQEVCKVQEIARELVAPTQDALAKAHAYIQYLHEYFDIARTTKETTQ